MEATLTARELAAKLGVTPKTIHAAVRASRIVPAQHSPRRFAADTVLPAALMPRVPNKTREQVAKLRADGHTQAQIAAIVGCGQKTVSRILGNTSVTR